MSEQWTGIEEPIIVVKCSLSSRIFGNNYRLMWNYPLLVK